ncbi:FAD-dependent monooxygenase [Nocardia sp. CA-107356]
MTSVLIIGTGFGGLATALELKRRGLHDFVIRRPAWMRDRLAAAVARAVT